MRAERAKQFARLSADGSLDQLAVSDEWASWKPIVSGLGMLALTVGLLLVVAIFWAMARVLTGG